MPKTKMAHEAQQEITDDILEVHATEPGNSEARVREAREALDAALVAGEDTGIARQALARAEEEAAEESARQRQAKQAQARQERQSIDAAAEAMVKEAVAHVEVELAELTSPLVGIKVPDLHPGTARTMLQQQAGAQQESAKAREVDQQTASITRRITDLDTRRKEIVARRAQGDHREGDGPELALIAADTEGLEGLLQKHMQITAATRDAKNSSALAAHAEKMWRQSVDGLRAEVLLSLAGALDAQLAKVAELLRLAPGTNFGSQWKPGKELQVELQRIGR